MTRLLKRLPIVVVLLAAFWLFRGGGSQEVSLTWVLPTDPPTTEARIRLLDEEGAVASSVTWAPGQGEGHLSQRAWLTPGAYRIQALLRRGDGSTKDVARELLVERDDEAIRVYLE